MTEEILKLADLSGVKVGDTIWTIRTGETKVTEIRPDESYPISTEYFTYSIDGKYHSDDIHPSAFLSNPFENIGFQERWMMVSMHGGDWRKRKVFAKKNGMFLAWYAADTDEDAILSLSPTSWRYAKEIEEPKELTLEERIERLEKLNKL